MNGFGKLMGEFRMTWVRVIVFAVLSAAITTVFNLAPIFQGTSFQCIAVYLDCWIVFALFIIVNCDTWLEAALKCFIFFVISQPLIYLFEVPFTSLGWGIFQYYHNWIIPTLLTFPAAVIGFFITKRNWLSLIILSIATGYLAYESAFYFQSLSYYFPRYLISFLFCLVFAVLLVCTLLDRDVHRAVGLIIVAIIFVVSLVMLDARVQHTQEIVFSQDVKEYVLEGDPVASVEVEGNDVHLNSEKEGHATIRFLMEDGTEVEYDVTVSGGGIYANEIG